MKKITYISYGVWIGVSVLLSLLKICSWWVGLSWLWLPLGATLSLAFGIFSFADFSAWMKNRKESKIPQSCENCLFGKAASLVNDGKCLGETMQEVTEKGTICKYYRRDKS